MSKIVDREGLKAFRERLDDKYVIEGEYSPQTSVGLADNLTPYSEESGVKQSNPFISNGTGTNSNQEIVTVGDYGLLRSKNGNTVCVNQYAHDLNVYNWTTYNGNATFDNGIATFTATAKNGSIRDTAINTIQNHKYLMFANIKLTTANSECYLALYDGLDVRKINIQSTTSLQFVIGVVTAQKTSVGQIQVRDERASGWDAIQVSNIKLIDLTQWFNGNIPQDILDNPSHFSWYYNGDLSYNTGTLVNANGVKLVSTGRNLWDEEWEEGAYSSVTGAKTSWVGAIRSTNKQRALPNTDYYLKFPTTEFYIYWYDKNDNFIGYDYKTSANRIVTSPSNAYYFAFCTNNTYGSTYNNDITISLYFTPQQGGEGYDKYYPYETPYEVDTGNEVLRSAGSVYDYKEPNGTIHRKIGVVDLGTLNWSYNSGDTRFYSNGITDSVKKMPYSTTIKPNILCSKYETSTNAVIYAQTGNKVISIEADGYILLRDTTYTSSSDLKNSLNGVLLFYELATPTTEQGTPFAENLPINDYGMLYWLDENNNLVSVPQGNTIFFPINYKGFLDDMYHRVDGDSSKFVIDTELQASETQRDTIDTQLKNAIGGTLRQCLCVKESLDFDKTNVVDLGDLNWDYNTSNSVFYAQVNEKAIGNTNMMTTKYKVDTVNVGFAVSNNCIAIGSSNNYVYIKDTTYTDATTFKNAMKGVLLAYEKAS